MCLAIPGKVVSIENQTALVDFDGVQRQVQLELLADVAAGDYVLTHAGFAIQRIDQDEAEKTLALFRALAEAEGGADETSVP